MCFEITLLEDLAMEKQKRYFYKSALALLSYQIIKVIQANCRNSIQIIKTNKKKI